MNMYNAVFAQNKDAAKNLHPLGLSPSDFGRFRDSFIFRDITLVIARIGGEYKNY